MSTAQHVGVGACQQVEMFHSGIAVTEPRSVANAGASAMAWEVRFDNLRPRLVALAGSLVGRDAAEDVVQDAYLRARSRIGQLRDPGALDAWLTRIVIRTAYNHHRRRVGLIGRLARIGPAEPTPSRDVGLRELIDRLPGRERTVLVLHYAYGYALAEIAEMLGLSHVNVRTIIFRARRRLAAEWEADR
jgi:RNA polymerase sigma factor (sigma-70 family)